MEPESSLYETATFGPTPLLEATATLDKGQEALTIFAVNRNRQEPLALMVDLRGLSGYRVDQHLVLTDEEAHASNTIEDPDRVRPRSEPGRRSRMIAFGRSYHHSLGT